MARDVKTYIEEDINPNSALVPESLTKHQFARRLRRLMHAKGWTQSELARRADIKRGGISSYIRAQAMPGPTALSKLAAALGVAAHELLPNQAIDGISGDAMPTLEIKAAAGAPNTAWLHVNRLVLMSTAVKVAEILQNDDTPTDRN